MTEDFDELPAAFIRVKQFPVAGAEPKQLGPQYFGGGGGFTSGFFSINGGWHVLGIGLSLLLAAPAVLLPGRTGNYPAWHFTTPGGWFTIATVLAMLVANGLFGKLLRAPTVAFTNPADVPCFAVV